MYVYTVMYNAYIFYIYCSTSRFSVVQSRFCERSTNNAAKLLEIPFVNFIKGIYLQLKKALIYSFSYSH